MVEKILYANTEDNTNKLEMLRSFAKGISTKKILCFARIDRTDWDGTSYCYNICNSLEEVFHSELEDIVWYLDENDDLRGEGSHEYGKSFYWYRELSCAEDDIDYIEAEIILGTPVNISEVEKLINNLTSPLGEYFNSIA